MISILQEIELNSVNSDHRLESNRLEVIYKYIIEFQIIRLKMKMPGGGMEKTRKGIREDQGSQKKRHIFPNSAGKWTKEKDNSRKKLSLLHGWKVSQIYSVILVNIYIHISPKRCKYHTKIILKMALFFLYSIL